MNLTTLSKRFEYPNKLNIIFDKLIENNIFPIIVGGYVRDFILNIPSKDIDIELYNAPSLEKIETILKNFGKVNSVGKSFGVTKLQYKDLDLDFSLPREDTKTLQGHTGFDIKTYKNLSFKTAASRRDFTINSIGFDIAKKTLLDPFHGVDDLEKKILRATNEKKFTQDPLRILRAVGFCSRFELKLDTNLFLLLSQMVQEDLIDQLPKERIFIEIQKILLKSKQKSIAFELIKKINAQKYFFELYQLDKNKYNATLLALDKTSSDALLILLSILSYYIDEKEPFLQRFLHSKSLIKKIITLVKHTQEIDLNNINPYNTYKLAKKVKIKNSITLLKAISDKHNYEKITSLELLAKELGVYTDPKKELLTGDDLIALGLHPSKEFSVLLNKGYEAQIKGIFTTHQEGIRWLKSILT
jgi:tRNA nucleotidyltransferase (CCA-adding enzyme)